MTDAIKKLRIYIKKNKDEKNATFLKKLSPETSKHINGLRLPELRKFAKSFIIEEGFSYDKKGIASLRLFIKDIDWNDFDETLFSGLIIASLRVKSDIEIKNKISLLKSWLKKADGWALTDSVDSTLKPVNENDLIWLMSFIKSYAGKKTSKEFERRFCIAILMSYFINDKYIDAAFTLVYKLWTEKYYVQMMTAWFFQVSALKYYERTLKELETALKKNKIDNFTYNKALQKMIESRRFSDKQKMKIRSLKKPVLK